MLVSETSRSLSRKKSKQDKEWKDKYLKVVEDILKYPLFSNSEMRVKIIWMRTHMNDSIHVQVKVVKLWYLRKKRKKINESV